MPEIGDYVLGHRWSDALPEDPWFVGILVAKETYNEGNYHQIAGSRWFKHCLKITPEQGEWLIRNQANMYGSRKSLKKYLRELNTP